MLRRAPRRRQQQGLPQQAPRPREGLLLGRGFSASGGGLLFGVWVLVRHFVGAGPISSTAVESAPRRRRALLSGRRGADTASGSSAGCLFSAGASVAAASGASSLRGLFGLGLGRLFVHVLLLRQPRFLSSFSMSIPRWWAT